MTITPQDAIFQYLPDTYRRAGKDTDLYQLVRTLGILSGQLEQASRAVLKAHAIRAADDLTDLEQLAAPYGLVPWQYESVEAFRHRVVTTARVRLQGAATAAGMLEMIGAAFYATLETVTLPGRRDPVGACNDAYTTTGELRSATPPYETFTAATVDMPPSYRETAVTKLLAGGDFEVDAGIHVQSLSDLLDPQVDITGGNAPLVVPILVQRDLGRALLINRVVPRGATIRINVAAGSVQDTGGTTTLPGPITLDDRPAPTLLYGTLLMLPDAKADPSNGPTLDEPRLYRWSQDCPVDGEPWFMRPGKSLWRLLVAGDLQGDPLKASSPSLPLAQVRPMVCPPVARPKAINVRTQGRRPGTFTILYKGSDGWQADFGGSVTRIRPHPLTGDFIVQGAMGSSGAAGQPVVDIVADAHPVVAPILLQQDLRRMVLINRIIPPGTTLRVDFDRMALEDGSDLVTRTGPITLNGKPAPDLLYGYAPVLLDDAAARPLPGPGKEPAYLVYWTTQTESVSVLPPTDGDQPLLQHLLWPPLFNSGRMSWRLMVGMTPQGVTPGEDEPVELAQMRIMPCHSDLGPRELRVRWRGKLDVPHAWLEDQLRELKLAGVMYLDPGTTALLAELPRSGGRSDAKPHEDSPRIPAR